MRGVFEVLASALHWPTTTRIINEVRCVNRVVT